MTGTDLDRSALTTPTANPDWSIGGTGNFNNDNQTDILWHNRATGQNAVWLIEGTTLDTSILLDSANLNWQIGNSGNFNNDNQTDILWRNTATGQNALWLMQGARLDSSTLLDPALLDWQIGG